ncbi:phosphate uptake regulator PhoU [Methanothrix harundinacea]|uniref:Phosphate regulatory protein-like protein n=1 Tax=Methanothrix harundinacea (strain 6Ac) TaxID=1110509 RepID=G7WQD4_METH6|nr:phosphate uptake regulator PhoU [Methanothrix harundinacea]AET65487.1 Phosphate regulatory protein-like protein [Methanothrix harundinacea 6Ac]
METRKVQRTGKSTFIVSLPKLWAVKNDIQPGSLIYITQSDNGALVLSPDRSERELATRLEIGDKVGDPLIRDIIGCYVSGYRTIEVTGAHMTADQKRDIHQIVQKLIGPEILEETVNKVLIQDLIDPEELQSERALRRIKTVVRSMIQDALTAMVTNDREMAADVVQRDDDVDRLYLLVSRQFTEILRSGSLKEESIDPITAFNYTRAATNLERMADHASRIADMILQCDCTLPAEVAEGMGRISPQLLSLIEDSISSLLLLNSGKANEVIELSRQLRREMILMVSSASSSGEHEDALLRMVASSIERILDYIKNIGELAINLSQTGPRPEAK